MELSQRDSFIHIANVVQFLLQGVLLIPIQTLRSVEAYWPA